MRFAGSAARAHDAGQTPLLHSGPASRVNPLGARVQSCICWSSEAGAAGHAPQELCIRNGSFFERFRRKKSPVVLKMRKFISLYAGSRGDKISQCKKPEA